MRVIMKYGGYGSPCSDHFEGEMEDYTVNISSGGEFFAESGSSSGKSNNDSETTTSDDGAADGPIIKDRSDVLSLTGKPAIDDLVGYWLRLEGVCLLCI